MIVFIAFGENEMRPLLLLLAFLSTSTAMGQHANEIINSIGMKLVLINPGTFSMNSPNQVAGRKNDSQEVSINEPFYLGVFEVSQDDFEKVMGNNPSKFKGPKNPVDKVSWDEAIAFCKKLSQMPEEIAAGREYRLPTEIEWEYACRAGGDLALIPGDALQNLGDYAWYSQNSGGTSHPVGEKKPNAWGLYDMYGNVFEWCQDVYSKSSSATASEINSTLRGPSTSAAQSRVARGGGWNLVAGYSHSARRTTIDPSERYFVVGFRVACRSAEIKALNVKQ